MKKRSLIFCLTALLIIILSDGVQIYADVNENESRVLEAAQQVFEYNGQKYVSGSEYIAKLRGYFMREDVDLSAGDADLYINQGIMNLEWGVTNGYLIPVDAPPEVTPSPEATPSPEVTPTPEATSSPDITPSPEITPSSEAAPSQEPDAAAPTKTAGMPTEEPGQEETGNPDKEQNTPSQAADDPDVPEDNNEGGFENPAGSNDTGGIIKATGYDLSGMLYLGGSLVLLMLAAAVITKRYGLI